MLVTSVIMEPLQLLIQTKSVQLDSTVLPITLLNAQMLIILLVIPVQIMLANKQIAVSGHLDAQIIISDLHKGQLNKQIVLFDQTASIVYQDQTLKKYVLEDFIVYKGVLIKPLLDLKELLMHLKVNIF